MRVLQRPFHRPCPLAILYWINLFPAHLSESHPCVREIMAATSNISFDSFGDILYDTWCSAYRCSAETGTKPWASLTYGRENDSVTGFIALFVFVSKVPPYWVHSHHIIPFLSSRDIVNRHVTPLKDSPHQTYFPPTPIVSEALSIWRSSSPSAYIPFKGVKWSTSSVGGPRRRGKLKEHCDVRTTQATESQTYI